MLRGEREKEEGVKHSMHSVVDDPLQEPDFAVRSLIPAFLDLNIVWIYLHPHPCALVFFFLFFCPLRHKKTTTKNRK